MGKTSWLKHSVGGRKLVFSDYCVHNRHQTPEEASGEGTPQRNEEEEDKGRQTAAQRSWCGLHAPPERAGEGGRGPGKEEEQTISGLVL